MRNNIKKAALALTLAIGSIGAFASSHREAPLISSDPLADNTDVYAFVSPDNANKVTIIANYVPFQLPQGGPNYYSFGENIRYEIHIDNSTATTGDDIVYRFTFTKVNQDPTTFFNIRLAKQNLKTTYKVEKSIDGGTTFNTIVTAGSVAPANIGERSIAGGAGLSTTYGTLFNNAITTASGTSSSGEKVFCGTADDPFFVDLGGVFDLGDMPRQTSGAPRDGLKCKNVCSIAIQVDISALQHDGHSLAQAVNILDSSFVIGVWASASRQQIRTLSAGSEAYSGNWVQVSRLGMPLTNEAVIPIGYKDKWNSMTPYQDLAAIATYGPFFYQPELALYMDTQAYASAVPAFNQLRIQRNSYTALGNIGFANNQSGVYPITSNPLNLVALQGTALDPLGPYYSLLVPNDHSPRSVDIWPIFNTGVPNLAPYQLATGKTPGNPFTAGKPFINNFLPTGGDMLRLNMAVPATPRNSTSFSTEGLLYAAVLGLTDTLYNGSDSIQFIPNMDGFPNGRRLEDDVTRIELQAVSGVVLAAIGLFYDEYQPGNTQYYPANPLTPELLNVLTYNTGVNANDTTFRTSFPYVQTPWEGTGACGGQAVTYNLPTILSPSPQPVGILGLNTPEVIMTTYPNPFTGGNTIAYHVSTATAVVITLYDINGRVVKTLVNEQKAPGDYTVEWNGSTLGEGTYFAKAVQAGKVEQSLKLVKVN